MPEPASPVHTETHESGDEDSVEVTTGRLSWWLAFIFGVMAIALTVGTTAFLAYWSITDVLAGRTFDGDTLFMLGTFVAQGVIVAAVGPVIGLACGSSLAKRFGTLLSAAVGSCAGVAFLIGFLLVSFRFAPPRIVSLIVPLTPLFGAVIGAFMSPSRNPRVTGFARQGTRRARLGILLGVLVGGALAWTIRATDGMQEGSLYVSLILMLGIAGGAAGALSGAERTPASGFDVLAADPSVPVSRT